MKIDSNSSFQKLAAGKVPQERKDADPLKEDTKVPEQQIEKAVRVNVDAASAISRVATTESGGQVASTDRAEVEESVRTASETKPEDVSNLADLLASRIRKAPEQALQAHKDPNVEKIHQLLQ